MAMISVIIAVYNAEQYLNESINSILNQSFKDYEIIIINDGSTDKSLEIIESYKDSKIRYLNINNSGPAVARNVGLKYATGKYIAIQDADDISLSHRLSVQYDFLENNSKYVLIGSNADVIDKDGEFVYTTNVKTNWNDIKAYLPHNSFIHSSVLYRKEVAEKAGFYNTELSKFNISEDTIFIFNMARYGRMTNIKNVLVKYRLSPNASTLKSSSKGQYVFHAVESIAKKGYISSDDKILLRKYRKSFEKKNKESYYYFHLCKKYMFNNYNVNKARLNILKALKFNPLFLRGYAYLFFTFIPRSILIKYYHCLKSKY